MRTVSATRQRKESQSELMKRFSKTFVGTLELYTHEPVGRYNLQAKSHEANNKKVKTATATHAKLQQ